MFRNPLVFWLFLYDLLCSCSLRQRVSQRSTDRCAVFGRVMWDILSLCRKIVRKRESGHFSMESGKKEFPVSSLKIIIGSSRLASLKKVISWVLRERAGKEQDWISSKSIVNPEYKYFRFQIPTFRSKTNRSFIVDCSWWWSYERSLQLAETQYKIFKIKSIDKS